MSTATLHKHKRFMVHNGSYIVVKYGESTGTVSHPPLLVGRFQFRFSEKGEIS